MRPAVIISPQSPRFFHLIIGFLQMLKHLISISALVVVASGACFDNGDKEIGGACYKFVAQKLSFNDARDWCHYKNPVTASYLAHVPNQFTANFLASYARSAFGQNDGYFWIGLSRTKNWTPWTWDTGYAAAFTNFNSDQLTQNWAAESVVNTKWSTFGEEEKMNFVCSYDPTEPPTFAPPTSAGPTTTPRPTSRPITTQSVPTTTDYYDECLPGQKTTFLYGYSNDLDPQTVKYVTDSIIAYPLLSEKYVTYGNVRFDTVLQETIFLSDNLSSFEASVNSNLPDPNVGFQGSDRGSNVVDMLRGFLSFNNTCGTFILLNMKRNVHEQELTDVIESLRKHRVYVYTVASDKMVNSEDTFKQLYAMSVGSNGLLAYDEDSDFDYISHLLMDLFAYGNPYYATSVQVSGNGSVVLPMFYSVPGAENKRINIGVNTQDHALPISNLHMEVDFNGPKGTDEHRLTSGGGTFTYAEDSFDFSQDYNVTLKYQYADNNTQTVDIRMYVQSL